MDASTYRGSVAVFRSGTLLAEGEAAMRGATEERFMPAVADVVARASLAVSELDAVVCGDGPGSFTSLRIAAGIAKGLATALRIQLFAVPSLGLAVAAAGLAAGRYCAVLDALRGDAYAALYDVDPDGGVAELQPARVVSGAAVESFAAEHSARLISIGAASDGSGIWPRAAFAPRLREWLQPATAVDVAGWQPVYGRLAEAQVKWEAAHGRPLAGA